MEDYCHAVEHSIEFQVAVPPAPLRTRHPNPADPLRIFRAKHPEWRACRKTMSQFARFLGRLGEIAAREGDPLTWVLGIDMAHMGARYGDDLVAVADRGEMQEVARRDHARIERVLASDAQGFWEQVQENQDDLKWCGSSPLYTFLRAVPGAKGRSAATSNGISTSSSVVSFAAMTFTR